MYINIGVIVWTSSMFPPAFQELFFTIFQIFNILLTYHLTVDTKKAAAAQVRQHEQWAVRS